jgi:hypothetical protein
MDRTPLVKLLLISALSAGLVVPLFFYSRGLLRQAEQALAAAQASVAPEPDSPVAEAPDTQDSETSGHAQTDHDPAQAPSDPAQAKAADAGNAGSEPAVKASTAMALAQAGTLSPDQAGQTKADKPNDPSDPDAGAQVYKPPLFGSCKRMFQQLQKQVVAEGEYKAFAFAFDGKTANCAEYVSNKSLRHARAVVVKNCQEDRAVAKRYVACLLYEVQ